MPVPVLLFVYNRPAHTRNLISSLLANSEASATDLIIYSDAAKAGSEDRVKSLRDYLRTIQGFNTIKIIEREKNFGLAENIITGLQEQFEQYEKLIVLEDDLLLSPYFLRYMNDALELYENEDRVGSVHGYIYPVTQKLPETFFIRGADCWGWGTWKRAWKHFEPDGKKLLARIDELNLKKDFDYGGAYSYYGMLKKQVEGKNNSWAVRWHASLFIKGMLTLYPGISFVNNQGADASGTHVKKTSVFDTPLVRNYNGLKKVEIIESAEGREAIRQFFLSIHKNPLRRLFRI